MMLSSSTESELLPMGILERNHSLQIQLRQRLVHRLHPELVLTDLHLRIDLVDLVLANQVANGGGWHHHLNGEHTARRVRFREQRL